MQADLHGLLEKFGVEPPEMSQEENVEVSELFRLIRAYLAMADSGAEFKCELSATMAAQTLNAAVYGLLLRDPSFQWPSLDSLRPDALPALPKNIAKNFATYFHEKRMWTCQLGAGVDERTGDTSPLSGLFVSSSQY